MAIPRHPGGCQLVPPHLAHIAGEHQRAARGSRPDVAKAGDQEAEEGQLLLHLQAALSLQGNTFQIFDSLIISGGNIHLPVGGWNSLPGGLAFAAGRDRGL